MNKEELRSDFENWLRESRKLSEKTIKEYLFYFDKFNYEKFDQSTINYFTERKYNNQVSRSFIKNLKEYLIEHREKLELSQDQVNLILLATIPKIKGRKKVKVYETISKEELYKIESGFKSPDKVKNERYKLMLLISYFGALRVGSCVKIAPLDFYWQDFDKDNNKMGEVKVYLKGNKEGISIIPNWLMLRIREFINKYRWKNINTGKPIFDVKINTWEKKLGEVSLKMIGRKVNPHMLRHSLATELRRKGVSMEDIKEILNHSSISSTQIYAHADKSQIKETYQKVTSSPNIA